MKITLEQPTLRRKFQFLAAVAISEKLHRPWVDPPATIAELRTNLDRFKTPLHVGHWVFNESDEIVGAINVNEIVRGAFRSAYLGYYAFAPHQKKGYMTEGLRAAVTHAFKNLKLHRLEANIQPKNIPSKQLVKRLGFRLEGYSPRYLKIAGRWRDHERWAITAEEW
jgi:ribosomal-protein-alanine N-acetyltransferase